MAPFKLHASSIVLFGLALFVSVSGRFTTEHIDQFGRACNASEADLAIAKEYKVPTSETGKCLMKCMISKLGALNPDGSYNKSGMEESLKKYWPEWPLDIVEKINNKCYDEAQNVSADVIATCAYAYEVMACINKQSKLFGML